MYCPAETGHAVMGLQSETVMEAKSPVGGNWGKSVLITGREGYAILKLHQSEADGHTTHGYFEVLNEDHEGYLTDKPTNSNTLKIDKFDAAKDKYENYHVEFSDINSETGLLKISYFDQYKNNGYFIQYNYNKGNSRFAAYTSIQKLPCLYKLDENDNSTMLEVESLIEENTTIDYDTPLPLFRLTNEGATQAMLDAITIKVNELAQEGAYTLTRENGEIIVTFKKAAVGILYTFSAVIENSTEYKMNPVDTPEITVLDPNVKPTAPVITPTSGRIFNDTPITITGNGTIYYTTDGTEPSVDNGAVYSEAFNITKEGNHTVKAIVVSNKNVSSDVTTVNYTIPNTASLTINFLTNTSDGKSAFSNTTALDKIIESGFRYVESMGDVTAAYNNSENGIKLGSKSAGGKFTLKLKQPVPIAALSVSGAKYGSDATSLKVSAKVNNETIEIGTIALESSERTDLNYNISSIESPVSELVIESYPSKGNKRAYVGGLTIRYAVEEGAEDLFPKLTVDGVTAKAEPAVVGLEKNSVVTVSLPEGVAALPGETTVSVKKDNTAVKGDFTFADNKVTVKFDEAGTYNVAVNWGNDDYADDSAAADVTVIDLAESLTFNAPDTAKVGDEVEFTVALPAGVEAFPGGYEVTTKVGDAEPVKQEVTIEEGKFNLKFNEANDYVVTLKWNGNDAFNEGSKSVNVEVEKKNLTGVILTSNLAENAKVKDDVEFTVKLPEGVNEFPGDLTITTKLGEVETTEKTTVDENGKFKLSFPKAGTYTVIVNWPANDVYNTGSQTLDVVVEKKTLEDVNVTVATNEGGAKVNDEILVGVNKTLQGNVTIEVKDSQDNLVVFNPALALENNTMKVKFDKAGDYNITIKWAGTEEYEGGEVSSEVITVVQKVINPTLTAAPATNIKVNDPVKFTIAGLPAGMTQLPGEVTVKVNDEVKEAEIANNQFTLNFKEGIYTVVVEWADTDEYKGSSVKVEGLEVTKKELENVTATATPAEVEVGEDVVVTVTLPEGVENLPGAVTVTVKNGTTDVEGTFNYDPATNSVKFNFNEAGNYTATIKWIGDNIYKEGSVRASFTVKAKKVDFDVKIGFDKEEKVEEVTGTNIIEVGYPEGETEFPGEVTYTLTNTEGKVMEEPKDYKLEEIEGGYMLQINEAGIYTLTINWTGNEVYNEGKWTSGGITIYSAAYMGNNAKGVKCESVDECQIVDAGHYVFAPGTKDHQVKLTAPEKVEIYYLATEYQEPATAARIVVKDDTEIDTEAFKKHEGEYVTLPGEHGYLMMYTKKNGVESPVEKVIYTNDADRIGEDGVITGIYGIDADADVLYFDLNGHRVADRRLAPGIYIRVANGEAAKILVR